jgi:hypothetical protein
VTSDVDVVLKAYAVLEAVLVSESVEAAIATVRADLEVLAPEVLVRVATALAVESGRKLQTPVSAAKLHDRLQHSRVETIWAAS